MKFLPSIYIPLTCQQSKTLSELRLHPKVTYFVGENGSGKSTIIEALAIAAGFNAEGGSKNFRFKTADAHSGLHSFITLHRGANREKDGFFLRAESFFNVASEVDQLGPEILSSYGGISLHAQSHGESFLALITNRMKKPGLYIMDEPEAALSPMRQLSMLKVVHDLVSGEGPHSQFVIATHSPIILAYPESIIYSLDEGGPKPIAYEDTEHVQVTRAFLNKPDRFLNELLNSR